MHALPARQRRRTSSLFSQDFVNKNNFKVIIVDNQAYWVSENTFFVAESVNGEIQRQTARPVNTNGLSKVDLDKMLFILDSLKNGKKNDSSSAGNE